MLLWRYISLNLIIPYVLKWAFVINNTLKHQNHNFKNYQLWQWFSWISMEDAFASAILIFAASQGFKFLRVYLFHTQLAICTRNLNRRGGPNLKYRVTKYQAVVAVAAGPASVIWWLNKKVIRRVIILYVQIENKNKIQK